MFVSAARLRSSSPSRIKRFSEFGSASFRQHQRPKRLASLVDHSPRACSPKIIGRRLDWFSIRRGIIGVKQYNSTSIQLVAAHILRVVLPYVLLCAERQKRFDALGAGHRGSVLWIVVVGSAIFSHHGIFSQKSPPARQSSAGAM